MNLPDLVILALVEGVADVLPIDASAHALLVSKVVGWRAGSIAIAIHLGAALALGVYLWREVGQIGLAILRLRKARIEPGLRLLIKALLTAAPWIALAATIGTAPVAPLSDLALVGGITILCALAMGVIDRLCMTVKRVEHIGGITALTIGLAQLLAFIPGVGRVAVALTTARLLGLERPAAYRFVLLANIPVLLAAATDEVVQNLIKGVRPATTDILAFGLTFALVLLATAVAMSWVRALGLLPFALYRLGLGIGLIVLGMM